jgi:nucleotide-binding universal stress UspA family protein
VPAVSRILVATDLSPRSDRPLERALALGKQFGASVIVLHVLDGKKRLGSEEEQRLRALLQDEFGLSSEDAEICFEYGQVPSTIAKFADERACSLIITGVARYNSPRDFVLGTAVDYLVNKSSIPVLVVKRRARRAYDRLVVATDFSPVATNALLAAAELFPDAKVLLVHAYEAAFEGFLEHDTTASFIRDEARDSMARLLSELPAPLQARLETAIEEGPTASAISKHVAERGSDLLVLGTKSGRGHAHVACSSDGWKLPATEPCDVLIVRQPSGRSQARA